MDLCMCWDRAIDMFLERVVLAQLMVLALVVAEEACWKRSLGADWSCW